MSSSETSSWPTSSVKLAMAMPFQSNTIYSVGLNGLVIEERTAIMLAKAIIISAVGRIIFYENATDLNETARRIILSQIAASARIRVIQLRDIPRECHKEVPALVKRFRKARTLSLYKMDICGDLEWLKNLLSKDSRFERLEVAKCKLTLEDIRSLQPFMFDKITELVLEKCGADDAMANMIAHEVIPNAKLRQLTIANGDISEEGAMTLVAEAMRCKEMKVIDLSLNEKIGYRGRTGICEMMCEARPDWSRATLRYCVRNIWKETTPADELKRLKLSASNAIFKVLENNFSIGMDFDCFGGNRFDKENMMGFINFDWVRDWRKAVDNLPKDTMHVCHLLEYDCERYNRRHQKGSLSIRERRSLLFFFLAQNPNLYLKHNLAGR